MVNALVESPARVLSEIIKEKISERGAIPFHDFMDMALYHPETGYYTSSRNKIGPDGDYYTSPDITSVLGEMLGKQLEEMWYIVNKKPFTIIEYGAGNGSLYRDILHYLKNNPELYSNLNYYIIEKNLAAREKEEIFLTKKVQWIDDIRDITPINGCVLSNEMLDNFPVHRVVMKKDLMEVNVGYEDGFYEFLLPAPKALKEYFEELNVALPKGFCTEVNLKALKWQEEIASGLEKGFVLTIDYGYPSQELYRNDKRSGTLLCYNRHKVNDTIYNNIGKQDITAHVNFSALYHWGLKYGLGYCGYVPQSLFLHALGLNEYLRSAEKNFHKNSLSSRQKIFFLNTFMSDMGNKLKVLIQQKGVSSPKLSGLNLMFTIPDLQV
jgi:SAM-dependent MidA family methyltransferase